jgi:hypothetical protein
MDRYAMQREHLEEAKRHVAEGTQRVAVQRREMVISVSKSTT